MYVSCRNNFIKALNRVAGDHGRTVGIATTLGTKIVGSPAYLKNMYENAMCMIGRMGSPDLFITITANPKWPEIEVRAYSNTNLCTPQ